MTTTIAELKQKSKLPANRAGGSTVAQFFEQNKPALAAVLPRHVTPERMLKIALHAVRAVPKLMECTTESLFGAVVQCAQLGLEPNTTLGHAYMIPFRNKRENRTDVQVIIGYKGLIDLARRSGQIVSIAAHAVHQNDEFNFAYGLTEELTHRPAMSNRGEIIAFYAVAQLVGGGHAYEVMSRDDIDAIKASSQSGGKWGPWQDHYEEMGRKTAIRRLAKYLPLSIEFANAAALDATSEADQPQNLDAVLEGDFVISEPSAPVPQQEAPAETKEKFEYEISDPEEVPERTMPPAEEWPQAIPGENGKLHWVDSSGEAFDKNVHEWSAIHLRPTVKSDGTFRVVGAAEWPREIPDENGELRWADSTGKFFDKPLHAWSAKDNRPTVKSDGTFRARRRAGPRIQTEQKQEQTGSDDFGGME